MLEQVGGGLAAATTPEAGGLTHGVGAGAGDRAPPGPGLDGEQVAVVVVTYNSAPTCPACSPRCRPGWAGGLGSSSWPTTPPSDDSVALVRRLAPAATVVETGRNGGYAAGINAGVRGRGPHTAVLVLNADVRLGPGCVPELLSALRTARHRDRRAAARRRATVS